ncbi:MAG: DMT family transporter [Bacillota bacterium]
MYKNYSFILGIFISIMITLNSILSKNTNIFLSLNIIYLVGLITSSIILIKFKMYKFNKIPKYLLTGGIIGVFLVLLNTLTVNNIGVSLTIAIGLLGQIVMSLIVDNFGLFNRKVFKMKKEKILSLLFISIGIFIMSIS